MSTASERQYRGLDEFIARARAVLGEHLRSAVLYGSAAEDRLRAGSDVNLLLVLGEWHTAELDALRGPLRTMRAAIDLRVMLVLEAELPAVVEAFAVKFAEIAQRHRVLVGADIASALLPSREALRTRTRQELLNLTLRLRERYVSLSLREEQSQRALAHFAGGLRACAAALFRLRRSPLASGREALAALAAELGPDFSQAVATLSRTREQAALAEHEASQALLVLAELARRCGVLLDELPP
jgi:predicted nucleotidyltransferase